MDRISVKTFRIGGNLILRAAQDDSGAENILCTVDFSMTWHGLSCDYRPD